MGEEEDYGTLIYRDSQKEADAAVAAIKNSQLLLQSVKLLPSAAREANKAIVEEVIFIFSVARFWQKWNGIISTKYWYYMCDSIPLHAENFQQL